MYEYLCFFLFYAFAGWITEVVYAAVDTGKFVNRGFLNGPLCPVYGFGVIAVVRILSPVQENPLLLFFGAVLLTSIVELASGWLLEKAFNERWWDYSDEPFNFLGYICIKFSLFWGFACLFMIKIVHPGLVRLIEILPNKAVYAVLIVLYSILLIDILATVQTVLRLNRQLAELNRIAGKFHDISDDIGEFLYSESMKMVVKAEEIKEQREKLIRRDFFGKKRLMKAFPKMSSRKYMSELKQLKKNLGLLFEREKEEESEKKGEA
ncbi:putative ABC transporter permease [Parasporobacterium paucivorans]|uniref:Uncharacterized membrane protein n=1 Tax=Parasporobacterium paucivorans DSM 15970 TaxID=1122934 RepID=A0A1M6EP22_9FIRM|nr:putative ABC transporter permease [Parasporobacterium paucivorans]SHI87244.1 Uncharacterized membrane protein [Parasporobacterium paucivorans DSM 15970]